MSDPDIAPTGSAPPPNVTYVNPRRTSPEKSVTLRHHRAARDRDATNRPPIPTVRVTGHGQPHAHRPRQPHHLQRNQQTVGPSPQRRNSSGESNETGISDPQKWFDHINHNSKGNYDAMDIDETPFYQRETDSSNEEPLPHTVPTQSPAYRYVQDRLHSGATLQPRPTQSSSADDFRSVIDDLTIENKRLREELKRYRQMGPDSLRKDKLFEVKFHGMPSNKKRQLEATLRDFTTSIEGSSRGGSPSRKKKNSNLSKNIHSSVGGISKHASSSSGSNSRPQDSAYASMSAGQSSSGPSLPQPAQGKSARQRSDMNIRNYLRDIPEGLWPRPVSLTEKDKKKLVVKRLEHLFTGKIAANQVDPQSLPSAIAEDIEMETNTTTTSDDKTGTSEANREAQIRPRDLKRKKSNSRDTRDNGSASNTHSNSNGDQTDSRDNGNGSGGSGHAGGRNTGSNASPEDKSMPEQRPTRPRDLDPDRQQVPAENMDYIRHLGLDRPDLGGHFSARDVSPDSDGWVYLNLVCNLAQLHILNVTPDFIRSAVSEKSTKFQLSPDGRKIRWRGGIEGTRFSSDTSGSNSHKGQSSDDTDGSNEQDQRKKVKVKTSQQPTNDVTRLQPVTTRFDTRNQDSNSDESFHYKPLFVHHQASSSDEQPSWADGVSGSSYGPPDESNLGMNSRWDQSGVSGLSQRKRRRDGAIIYYSGAPFCTDLSGDAGETSPNTYEVTSSGDQGPLNLDINRPQAGRSTSGSSIPFRPLSTEESIENTAMDLDDFDVPELSSVSSYSDDIDANTEWGDSEQHAGILNLEASGLGGVYPDDHFVVVVSTRRPKSPPVNSSEVAKSRPKLHQTKSNETTDSKITTESIINKLACMSTNSPIPSYFTGKDSIPVVQVEYLTGKIRKLPPVPLPPPAFYIPSHDSSYSSSSGMESEFDVSDGLVSRQVLANEPPHSDNKESSGNDEEDELSEGDDEDDASIDSNEQIHPLTELPSNSDRLPGLSKMTTGSSAATAGGAASGYNSSVEDA